jgi:hypothetical protein
MKRHSVLLGLSLLSLTAAAAVGGCSQRQEGSDQAPSAAATDPNAAGGTGGTPATGSSMTTNGQTPTAPDMNTPSTTGTSDSTGSAGATGSTGSTGSAATPDTSGGQQDSAAGPYSAPSRSNSALAAAFSASCLDLPLALAGSTPLTTTSTVKTGAWSGPARSSTR